MLGLIIFTVVVIAILPHPSTTHHNPLGPVSVNGADTIKESIIPSLKKWTEVFAAVGVFTIVSMFLIVIKPDFFKKILSKVCFLYRINLKIRFLDFMTLSSMD